MTTPNKPTTEPLLYPCKDCGLLRTKAEGGTVFTVCDNCWEKAHPKTTEPRTAEEWTQWALSSWDNDIPVDNGSGLGNIGKTRDEWVEEAIRRAQEQTRQQAIMECFKIAEQWGDTDTDEPRNKWIAKEIFALLENK